MNYVLIYYSVIDITDVDDLLILMKNNLLTCWYYFYTSDMLMLFMYLFKLILLTVIANGAVNVWYTYMICRYYWYPEILVLFFIGVNDLLIE